MAITNVSKPSSSMANSTRVSHAELWSTITTTWASETRTWLETGSLLENTNHPDTLGSYTFDQLGGQTFESFTMGLDERLIGYSKMINTSKP